MSCYEWTHGTIKLPSAEYAPFRQHVALLMGRREERLFEASQAFWKRLSRKQQTNAEEYLAAVNGQRFPDDITMDIHWRLQSVAGFRGQPMKPRRLIRTDFDFPTNRTLVFSESDLTVAFDKAAKTVTYSVSENNHAREHAAATTLDRAFSEAIAKVKWTHGTGGVLLGNDEYNRDAGEEYVGGGGSYVVAAYGYVGAKEAPGHVSEFWTPKGKVHVETSYSSRTGEVKGKIMPGPKPVSYSRSRW